MKMHNRLAHSAEHAFIGSLQRILGSTLSVGKVAHRDNDSSVMIKLPELNIQTVMKAEREVNSLISIGKDIKTHSFQTLEKAREHFPDLRANEERIKKNKPPIRVIEIEDHDIAACAMEHVSNLRECEFFLVTRISRSQGDSGYEINFAVQNQAKEVSMELSRKLLNICQDLGANINTVEETVRKLNKEVNLKTQKLKRLTADRLSKIKPDTLDKNRNVKLIREILYDLDEHEIQSFVRKITSHTEDRVIIMIAYLPSVNQDNASIIFARSNPLNDINCSALFSRYSSWGIRGGGKPTLATGVIAGDKINEFMKHLATDITELY
jgi:alanyl-tRNA synthetase